MPKEGKIPPDAKLKATIMFLIRQADTPKNNTPSYRGVISNKSDNTTTKIITNRNQVINPRPPLNGEPKRTRDGSPNRNYRSISTGGGVAIRKQPKILRYNLNIY